MNRLAMRYAAKEAMLKALGCGMTEGISWQDMEVINATSGQPQMVVQGGASEIFESKIPDGSKGRIDLSMSDDNPFAVAFIVLSILFTK
jgi:holo-[acyl-carrier protein] synthase